MQNDLGYKVQKVNFRLSGKLLDYSLSVKKHFIPVSVFLIVNFGDIEYLTVIFGLNSWFGVGLLYVVG